MPSSEERLIKVMKALADGTRLQLFKEIASRKQMTCTEVGEISDLAQPTVSHHLKLLVDAGLVNTGKNGRFVILSVNKEMTSELSEFLKNIINTEK
ncbi:MAG: metalloregulator ArsR/SmtB family transcription factor [Ignavibacteria bacterium]|nr:metalloregulator ArsR/SmtB family transcription factor [Ignavibacteria bacterium]